MEVPATIYVALGAIAAALVAGFFSFLNLVSSKENKVSEFRQSWIDGIRNEIAIYNAALLSLVRFRSIEDKFENERDWYLATDKMYRDVSESLTRIQLRLNPAHALENPESHEAKLLNVIHAARDLLNNDDFDGAFNKSEEIRPIAAPFLKEEWERVKNGEQRYQSIRDGAQRTIKSGIVLLVVLAFGSLLLLFLARAS
jgi:hypothetical protein